MSGALAGLRVIDCSRLIAGGVLATVLADHGADVIKVENPRGGDPLRTWLRDRGELWWKVYARGKRSITLNLTQPRGQALLKRLVSDADVLLENFVPGTFERWGLGWDALSAANPKLVFARVSGWGQDGPYRDRPGCGQMVEAMSGFAHTTGEAEGPPTLPSFPMADMVAALAGASAVLAALRYRDQVSGRGQVVDISLYEPLLSVLGPDAAGHGLGGVVPRRHGNAADRALGGARAGRPQPRGLRRARRERGRAGELEARRDRMRGAGALALTLLAALAVVGPAAAADYTGPLIDAHSHLPNATAIDAYVAAMKRHNVRKVVLLGVGGVQPDEVEWIEAAVKKYSDHVSVVGHVPDPATMAAAGQLDVELARTKARVMGEVHIRQASRKIERDPSAPAFMKILELSAQRGVPIVIHDELTPAAAASLEAALAAHREAVIVLAHAGEAKPRDLERLLGRHAHLRVDLSGMHFQRTPSLAKEKGPLHPAWKALIAKMPDRFLMGVDALAARLFEPAMLDRLMTWTRRVLGELPPDVAERVAWKNASVLYHLD